MPRIKSLHQAQSALPQSFPLLANPALSSLEPWTATMSLTTTAAANVLRTSQFLVSLTTQPLVLDSGHHLLALQTAVAARVSGGDKIVKSFLLERKLLKMFLKLSSYSLPQVMSPHQTTPTTIQTTLRRQK